MPFCIDGKPQWAMKVRILRKYLRPWAGIISSRFPRAHYVDGFAGCGLLSYRGQEIDGSPLVALQIAADVARAKAEDGVDFQLRCHFVDTDEAACRELKQHIARRYLSRFAHVSNQPFDQFISLFLDEVPKESPVFVFVDPTAIVGVEMQDLRRTVSRRSGEVLVNFQDQAARRSVGQLIAWLDSDGATRRYAIDRFFGTREWHDVWMQSSSPAEREEALLALFQRQLKVSDKVMTLPLRIRVAGAQHTKYHLVFATSHPLGYKIMKSIAKAEGEDPLQITMRFTEPTVQEVAAEVAGTYAGQRVRYKQMLVESPHDVGRIDRALKQLVAEGNASQWPSDDPRDPSYRFADRDNTAA